jgi:hypothetical protein
MVEERSEIGSEGSCLKKGKKKNAFSETKGLGIPPNGKEEQGIRYQHRSIGTEAVSWKHATFDGRRIQFDIISYLGNEAKT